MDSILIPCPECKKQVKVPASAIGKKIRCKGCEHIFTVKEPPKGSRGPAGKPAPPAKPAKPAKAPPAKPARAAKPSDFDDEDEEGGAYGLTGVDLKPRCPQCAAALEEEAVICLNCGYNIETRELGRTRKIKDVTGGEKFLWLLPGILCALAVVILIGYCFFHHFGLPPALIDNWDEEVAKDKTRTEIIKGENVDWWKTFILHPAGELWLFMAAIWASWKAGRFAVKRLILHPNPPEVEVR